MAAACKRADGDEAMQTVETVPISRLKINPRNVRTHPKSQLKKLAHGIRAFGFCVPILIDEAYEIIAGHGRVAAAQELGLTSVPAIVVRGLSEAKKRALALADNRLPADAGWDRQGLAAEVEELNALLVSEDLDISITGFEPVEIEQLQADLEDESRDPDDEIQPHLMKGVQVSQPGDIWSLGQHRLMCGDARDAGHVAALMQGDRASMAFLDPPYNLPAKIIGGRGNIKHEDFAMAHGEMSFAEHVAFLKPSFAAAAAVSHDGAVHYIATDWRHVGELTIAGTEVYGAFLNIAVWDKTNAGQGSFYRSQHEMIGVFRVGQAPHLNNVQLGRHGRNRSNVWRYAGVNTFRAGRLDDLKSHPTAKPIALVADAMKDCTKRGDVVLDTFSGSGTTLLAAERVGRRACALELEPRFVDVAIRRWQEFTRKDAIHQASGRTFQEIEGSLRRTAVPTCKGAKQSREIGHD